MSKISRVLQVKDNVSCRNSRFLSSSACRDLLFTGLGLFSDLALGPIFKMHFRTVEASMTVRAVADVAVALCQAFLRGFVC